METWTLAVWEGWVNTHVHVHHQMQWLSSVCIEWWVLVLQVLKSPSPSLTAILIQGAAHHLDLRLVLSLLLEVDECRQYLEASCGKREDWESYLSCYAASPRHLTGSSECLLPPQIQQPSWPTICGGGQREGERHHCWLVELLNL